MNNLNYKKNRLYLRNTKMEKKKSFLIKNSLILLFVPLVIILYGIDPIYIYYMLSEKSYNTLIMKFPSINFLIGIIILIAILICLEISEKLFSHLYHQFSYNKYKNRWSLENTPSQDDCKNFILIHIIFKNEDIIYKKNIFFNIIRAILKDINKIDKFFCLQPKESFTIKALKYSEKTLNKKLEIDTEYSRLTIFSLFDFILSVDLTTQNANEKYQEIIIESAASNYKFPIEDYIQYYINIIASHLNIIYGRIIYSPMRYIIGSSFYYEGVNFRCIKNISKIEENFKEINLSKIVCKIPTLYWGNILNDYHIKKILDINKLKDIIFSFKKINNCLYLQLTKKIKEFIKEDFELQYHNLINNYFSNIIDFDLMKKKYEFKRNWNQLVDSLRE